jgi:acetoin utilization protein AcuB
MYVKEHMSAPAVTVTAETTAAEAGRILAGKGFRHLPVVDDEGFLVGIFSDRDLRSLLPSGLEGEAGRKEVLSLIEKTALRHCMTKDPRYLESAATLDDALHIMEKTKIGALPVVDADRKVVGVFAVPDLMRAYRELFGIGEEGSAFLEIGDDGTDDLPGRIFAVLAAAGVPLLRYVRRQRGESGAGAVYLRVSTYNIHALKEALAGQGIVCRQGE